MISYFINIFRVLRWIGQSGCGKRLLRITGISSGTDVSRATYGFF